MAHSAVLLSRMALRMLQCMSRGAPHEKQPKIKLNNGKEMPMLALGK